MTSSVSEDVKQLLQRVEEPVNHPLFEWDDRVLRDRNELRTDLAAAGRDVTVPDAMPVLQVRNPVFDIQRMHLERGCIDQEAGAYELIELAVIAQDVAHVLAKEALDALAKFLYPFDVGLPHAPGTVRRVGRPGLERLDGFLDTVVPGDVGDQVPDC